MSAPLFLYTTCRQHKRAEAKIRIKISDYVGINKKMCNRELTLFAVILFQCRSFLKSSASHRISANKKSIWSFGRVSSGGGAKLESEGVKSEERCRSSPVNRAESRDHNPRRLNSITRVRVSISFRTNTGMADSSITL